MQNTNTRDHHMICIFNDTPDQSLERLLTDITPEKDTRILCPKDEEVLLQAAQSSSFIIIALESEQDPALHLARRLKDNRMVVADIMAVILEGAEAKTLNYLSKGFDLCLNLAECQDVAFKPVFKQRVMQGSRRLSGFIMEEEYRRFSDALSCAPTSVMVFDQDKRIVFASEHYFRAYPKSAPRLIRGLSVHEAFDMMSKEESIPPESTLYDRLRTFWYSLNGTIEFSLDTGVTYRLKASALPNDRGTIVTAQNITEYVAQNNELKRTLEQLKKNAQA